MVTCDRAVCFVDEAVHVGALYFAHVLEVRCSVWSKFYVTPTGPFTHYHGSMQVWAVAWVQAGWCPMSRYKKYQG